MNESMEEFTVWVDQQDPDQFKAAVEEETGRIIRSSPALPAATSDEVLGMNYRDAQVKAMLNLWRRSIESDRS